MANWEKTNYVNDTFYKVAIEICDEFAGDVKDACVTSAKTQFCKK